MALTFDSLPDDVETLKAMLIAEHAARVEAYYLKRRIVRGKLTDAHDARG